MEVDIGKDIQKVINALMFCEQNNSKCRKCKKKKKENCLLFIRDSIAVALQFILGSLEVPEMRDTGFYS